MQFATVLGQAKRGKLSPFSHTFWGTRLYFPSRWTRIWSVCVWGNQHYVWVVHYFKIPHRIDKYSDTFCCCYRPLLQASSVTLYIWVVLAKRQWQFFMLLSTEKFCTASICPKIGKLQPEHPKIDPIQQLTQISLAYCIQFFSPFLLHKFTLKYASKQFSISRHISSGGWTKAEFFGFQDGNNKTRAPTFTSSSKPPDASGAHWPIFQFVLRFLLPATKS